MNIKRNRDNDGTVEPSTESQHLNTQLRQLTEKERDLEAKLSTAKTRASDFTAEIDIAEQSMFLGRVPVLTLAELRKRLAAVKDEEHGIGIALHDVRRQIGLVTKMRDEAMRKEAEKARTATSRRAIEQAAVFLASWIETARHGDRLATLSNSWSGWATSVPGALRSDFSQIYDAALDLRQRAPDLVGSTISDFIESYESAAREKASAERSRAAELGKREKVRLQAMDRRMTDQLSPYDIPVKIPKAPEPYTVTVAKAPEPRTA